MQDLDQKIGAPLSLELFLQKHIDSSFVQNLLSFTGKQWEEQEKILLREKKFEVLKNLITQKTNHINSLVEEFMVL